MVLTDLDPSLRGVESQFIIGEEDRVEKVKTVFNIEPELVKAVEQKSPHLFTPRLKGAPPIEIPRVDIPANVELLKNSEGIAGAICCTGKYVPNIDLFMERTGDERKAKRMAKMSMANTGVEGGYIVDVPDGFTSGDMEIPIGYNTAIEALRAKGWRWEDVDVFITTSTGPVDRLHLILREFAKLEGLRDEAIVYGIYTACSSPVAAWRWLKMNEDRLKGANVLQVSTEVLHHAVHGRVPSIPPEKHNLNCALFRDTSVGLPYRFGEDIDIPYPIHNWEQRNPEAIQIRGRHLARYYDNRVVDYRGEDNCWAIRYVDPRDENQDFYMKGSSVVKFANGPVVDEIIRFVKETGIPPDVPKAWILHQANDPQIIKPIKAKLEEHFDTNLHVPSYIARYGNVSSSTVPLVLLKEIEAGNIGDGSLIIAAAFGAGLNAEIGAAIVK